MLSRFHMFIDGQAVDASDNAWFESFDPHTAKPWALIPRGSQLDVALAVESAHQAFTEGPWPKLSATERGQLLCKLAHQLEKHADELAELEVQDNGKLIAEMNAQLHSLPKFYRYYGGLADKIEGHVIPIDKPHHMNYTRYEPLGVIAAITAWNSPLLLATMKLAPALAAGNTIVLKPSEHASASTLAFAKLIQDTGFPPGVINIITGFGDEVGTPLIEHPKVAKVVFTGGDVVGEKVLKQAAKNLTPVTLELGGKSPNIVFADANRDKALNGVISGIFAATGQTCIAGSRLLIEKSIHDEFLNELIAVASAAKIGNPKLWDTQVGPIATEAQYEKILNFIAQAKKEGARCVLGGDKVPMREATPGWYLQPSIFSHVDNQMTIAQQEIFGPVLAVIPFHDEEEALAIANDSPYGLAAGLWSENIGRVQRMTKQLQAGTVWVNTYRAFSPLSPFGGYKRSGIGRENGQEAIFEYLQVKSVWLSTEEDVPKNPFIMRV